LQDEVIAVSIHDYSRQPVALAPNQPAQTQIDSTPGAVLHRLADAPLEKIEIEILFSSRKTARDDL
jgi:hypothetical protein